MSPSISATTRPSVLLVGPYDPHCGEYTFLAPPLGVWRLKGVLDRAGAHPEVFDPNCCLDDVHREFLRVLARSDWDIIGISTTGMTLRYDLELAHLARSRHPDAIMVAGGMEATFRPDLMFELGPFDLVVLGEGERPLVELIDRVRAGAPLEDIGGTARRSQTGEIIWHHQGVLDPTGLRDAIFATPYEEMPYERYWDRLEGAYHVGALPEKAHREARLAEIRSVRLITLNYCPMGCSFCSSTNFLNAATGGTAPIRKLSAEDCLAMVGRIVAAQPRVRTVIFQDDIFVFTNDDRILPFCDMIVRAKRSGDLPADLQFISTNRIDAMNRERLAAMKRAGFRVLGFGVESFSARILEEFNKKRIHPHIEPNLRTALELGMVPFLDLILASPRSSLSEIAQTLRQAFRWLKAGCEMGMYPYVIPFSGAAMARDPSLEPHIVSTRQRIRGTGIRWWQPTKILPVDPLVRDTVIEMEAAFEDWIERLRPVAPHLPSRTRSLVWLLSASSVFRRRGERVPTEEQVKDQLRQQLPAARHVLEPAEPGRGISPCDLVRLAG